METGKPPSCFVNAALRLTWAGWVGARERKGMNSTPGLQSKKDEVKLTFHCILDVGTRSILTEGERQSKFLRLSCV